jgi:hypothetical protein
MTLDKLKEIYEQGDLVGEIFKSHNFIALLLGDACCLKNGHYSYPKVKDYIKLTAGEFSDVSSVIEEWEKNRDSLWGRISHGNSWSGHTSTTYFRPNSKKGINIPKGKSAESLGIGKLEEKLVKGELKFTLERFCIGIGRKGQFVLFDEWQVPLIQEVSALHAKRSKLYLPAGKVDVEEYMSLQGY